MDFIKITNNNIDILTTFLKNEMPSQFRYFKNRTTDCIANHKYTVVCNVGGEPVGYGHIDYEHKHWIGICILQKYQKNGYGTLLLNHLLDYSSKNGIERLWLSVDVDNNVAIKLYKKVGFSDESQSGKVMFMSKILKKIEK